MSESHSTDIDIDPIKKPVTKSTLRSSRKTHRRTMPAILRVLLAILLLVFLSVIYTWFILWRQNLCDNEITDTFISENVSMFAYSCLVVFCIMAAVAALTWRVFFASGFVFAVISVITFIHMQKFELRSAPLLPEDFQLAGQAGELTQFVETEAIVRLVCGVVFILVGSILLEYFVRKVCGRNRKNLPWWERFSVIPRVTFTLAAVTTLVLVAKPVFMHEDCSEWLEGSELLAWNQTINYETNGFVIGFLYNLGKLQMREPENYSEETMAAIAAKYRALKAADTERLPLDEVAENVIFVMDESFYDPALLTKYYDHTGGDVLPNLHKLFLNYPSGYMYSPEYGGNTANVEFEGQTGLSNFWAQTFPYVNSLTRLDKVMGVANWTKEFGFETTAVHAFDGSMYKRNFVYPILGFNEFIDADKMAHRETEGEEGYINDWAVYQEILDVIEENKGSQMVAAVTMQNHMPYTAANYPTTDFKVAMDNIWVEANYQSLYYADQYLGEFIKKLDALDEKTVLIWFGDHAAALLNSYINSDDKEERDIAHFTPYFVYANFDIESPYTVAETKKLNAAQGFSFPTRGVDLPTTTPNCLLNTMYDILGAEKPAMFYLLDTICEESPTLAVSYYSNGNPDVTTALKEYELVNYDVLGGKHYWYGD